MLSDIAIINKADTFENIFSHKKERSHYQRTTDEQTRMKSAKAQRKNQKKRAMFQERKHAVSRTGTPQSSPRQWLQTQRTDSTVFDGTIDKEEYDVGILQQGEIAFYDYFFECPHYTPILKS